MSINNPAPLPQNAPPPQAGPAQGYFVQPTVHYVVAHPAYSTGPTNGLATGALTLGILALLLCWVPVVGIVLALVGVGLGIPAIIRAQQTKIGLTPAIWGLALSAVSVLMFILIVIAASV